MAAAIANVVEGGLGQQCLQPIPTVITQKCRIQFEACLGRVEVKYPFEDIWRHQFDGRGKRSAVFKASIEFVGTIKEPIDRRCSTCASLQCPQVIEWW